MNLFKPTYHINPRYAIEITIRKFNPNISDKELFIHFSIDCLYEYDLRNKIFYSLSEYKLTC